MLMFMSMLMLMLIRMLMFMLMPMLRFMLMFMFMLMLMLMLMPMLMLMLMLMLMFMLLQHIVSHHAVMSYIHRRHHRHQRVIYAVVVANSNISTRCEYLAIFANFLLSNFQDGSYRCHLASTGGDNDRANWHFGKFHDRYIGPGP